MAEIKARQNQGKPVLNTAQQQMQRSFIKARQEQVAQKQNEQSESPNSYAEEKISRTAENAVRNGSSLAVREIGSLLTKGTMKSMMFRRNLICRRNIKRHLQILPLFPHRNLPDAVLRHNRNHLRFTVLTRFVLEAMKILRKP